MQVYHHDYDIAQFQKIAMPLQRKEGIFSKNPRTPLEIPMKLHTVHCGVGWGGLELFY